MLRWQSGRCGVCVGSLEMVRVRIRDGAKCGRDIPRAFAAT